MPEVKEDFENTNALICQNPLCRKGFSKPLSAVNLTSDSTKPYEACPYCLVGIKDTSLPTNLEASEMNLGAIEEKTEDNILPREQDTASDCIHNLGYLSSRPPDAPIPDQCMVCKDIVHCLYKKNGN